MSDPGHKIDAKTIATIVGLLSSLSGVVATRTLMQYRMDKLEERVASVEGKAADGEKALVDQAKDLRCTICEVHTIPCPGC